MVVDAYVVGGGPNGLAAAIVLARAGRSVTVLEAEDTIGGGARSAALTLPGFVHDVCSAIHPLALSSPFFRKLPLADHGLEWIQPPLPLAHPLDDDTAVVLERTVQGTAHGLRDAEDGGRWRGLFGPLVAGWSDLADDVLAPMLRRPRHPLLLARFGPLALLPARLFATRFRGARARALLAGLAAHSLLPLDAWLSSAFALVMGISAQAVGWPLPRGGSQRIADALAAELRANGGEIVTGRRVTSVDELAEARAVLFDLAPRQVEAIATSRFPEGYRRALRNFRHGPGVCKVDYALDGAVPWRAEACRRAGTVHVGGTLEEVVAAEAAVARGEHPDRPFVIAAQQSLFDDSRAPAGSHTLWAYCHVPNGSTVDVSDRIEAQLERFAPGFRDRVLAKRVATARDVERENANYVGGDIAGGAHTLPRLLSGPRLRRVPSETADPRLFICSASTPPGGGVHGMCGYWAARAALERTLR